MVKRSEQPRRKPTRRHVRKLALAFAACAIGNTNLAAEVVFDRYEGAAGEKRETLLTGGFLPGEFANVATVGIDENDMRQLRIFALAEGAWRPALAATLRSDIAFVDVAAVNGRDRLLTYERGRVNWFDPETKKERLLVALQTRWTGKDGVPAVDITRDVNGDGRDDLLLPDTDGFWFSTQTPDGRFAQPVKLGPPEPYLAAVAVGEKHTYATTGINATTLPWYLSRVHHIDYNRDERPDLLFWNEDHFDVYFQNEHGQFDLVPQTFTTDVPFDVDGTYALMFEYNDENVLGLFLGLRKKTRITMLHTLRDMNSDGVADLITLTLEGRSLANHRGRYGVHFGSAVPDGTTFAPEAGASIRPRGKAGALQASGYSVVRMRDLDGDGQTDVLFRDVAMGLTGMVRAMAGKSVALEAEFFRNEHGAFPRKATVRRRIRPRLYPVGTGVFFPPLLIGDVNGDGRTDLLTGKSREELHLFLGVPIPETFSKKPQKVHVALSDDERNTRLVDLDNDGKQDILVYNTRTTPHRLTALIAR